MKTFIFFRKDGWYPIELPSSLAGKSEDEIVADNIRYNPGTIKVEDVEGKIIWEDK